MRRFKVFAKASTPGASVDMEIVEVPDDIEERDCDAELDAMMQNTASVYVSTWFEEI